MQASRGFQALLPAIWRPFLSSMSGGGRVAAVAALLWAGLGAGPLIAQEGRPGVLLELYTSQGCSACPPADDMMRELAARDEVIALALHVDYWDYIGWKDTFAHPAFTARQKAYARANGARHVYTPQMIIAGSDVVVGAKPMAVADRLMAHLTAQPRIDLRAQRFGDRVVIRAPEPADRPDTPFVVHVVRYTAQADVDVTRGENAGKTLHHVNVVTAWDVAGEWPGIRPLELSFAVAGPEPIVVILQETGPRAVLAAVRID